MSSGHDHHDNHSNEPKTVSFRTPMILALVTMLLIVLAVSTCDKKHGCCEDETKCEENSEHHKQEGAAKEHGVTENAAAKEVPTETTLGKLDENENFIYDLGAMEPIKLGNTTLEVGKNSSEMKLYSFLSDKNTVVDTVDKTQGWITLDRVYFEKGKAVLTPESKVQIKNIATILSAFPDAHVKLGGYTDNSGNEETNIKISDERAKTALKELIHEGVAATRAKAEGYGPKHPVADNSTKEGMAQNRRVDIRITKK